MSKKKGLGVAPLLLAAASSPQGQKAMQSGGETLKIAVKETMPLFKKILYITLLWIPLTVVTYIVARKFWRQARYNNWLKKGTSDVNVQAAISIYAATPASLKKGAGGFLNPFGFIVDLWDNITTSWKAENTTAVNDIALKITDLDTTAKAFKILYEIDLLEMLVKGMGQTDFNKWMSSAKTDKNPYIVTNDTSIKGKKGITKAQTIGRYYWISGTSVYYRDMTSSIPSGSYVGQATGKTYKDKSTSTKYYELYISKNSKFYFLYLPKDDITLLSDTQYSSGSYSTTWTLAGIEALGRGVKVTLEQNPGGAMKQMKTLQNQAYHLWKGQYVVYSTDSATPIFNTSGVKIGTVGYNVLLGKYIATHSQYVEFKSISGTHYLAQTIFTLKFFNYGYNNLYT